MSLDLGGPDLEQVPEVRKKYENPSLQARPALRVVMDSQSYFAT